ncbi:MAG: addiction module toxin, HicA family [Okeania sp. SIO2G4]|nr:addiction module toxin, HicA family [Okeania sp. SIO4D6]NEP40797.1 addiction module toxin, HicA family [Okeania sp. SIO2H7]NEP71036.1 addiction module toxin, HicA family [Okeania sp. SIO2G5]NEP91544.1 addiction module toxin, HicA family [Okeania sp. SIO2F5]NEQ89420.1 addiction module toxin, HicA family [Okeania sp. SIO2G4]
MPKLPIISSKKAIGVLERLGFYQARQTGSHVVLKKPLPDGEIVCVVPMHKELKTGTLSGILRQAKVMPEEFIANL